MKSLSQGNKGIQALAKENPTLVENRFGYDVPGFFGGGNISIPRIGNIDRLIERNLANLSDDPNFNYARDVLGINIAEEDQTGLSPEEIEAKLAASRLARGYGSSGGMGTGGGNYASTTPGAPISIDARDETPDAYRFYPSEVSKLYSQMKGVPFSPLVAPPKEATYIDSMQPRKIKSQLYAKDGTYVNANPALSSYMKDAIHTKYFKMPTAPLRMGINAADKLFGNRPILGGITNALSGGLNRIDDFTRSLLDKETYKQRNEQANEQENEQVNELINQQVNEQTDKRRMELPRFTQDRDAIFQENVEAFRDRDSTQMMADGGFPEREELVTGPGGEKGDKIPAMLSEGEFIFNSAAVRGMGIMSGASPDDEYEQRLMGARKMYEFQKEAEEMAKRYA
jgi:hypothetical protein